MSRLQKNIVNIVMFNGVWLLCVLGGSAVAAVSVAVTLAFHMKFISLDRRELWFIACVALVGLVVEFCLIHFSVLRQPDGSGIPPVWLLLLWPLFAITLNHSTSWFQNHLWPSAVAGAIAGPLTYYTGTRLTDYEIVDPFNVSMIKLIIVWMVVFPGLMLFARRFNLRR